MSNHVPRTVVFVTLALAAGGLLAQQTKPATPATPAAAPQAAAPAGPAFKSPAEQTDYTAVYSALQNPATTPAQMETAVNDFMTKYPDSQFKTQAATIAYQFFTQKNDYDKMLVFGELALKADPNNLQILSGLAAQIPTHVHDTDLDRDQRLAEANTDAQKLLSIADSAGPDIIPGRTLTPDQVAGVKQQLQATAYASMAHSALDKKDYNGALTNYQKAIAMDAPQKKAYDLVFQARAQEGLQKWSDANASLDQAAALTTAGSPMMQAITTERDAVKKLQAGGH